MPAKSRKEQLQEMLAEDPSDPFLRYGLGMELVGEGNLDQAIECFKAIVDQTADYIPAYQQAGQALIRLGRVDEARAILGRGVDAARAHGESHAAEEMQGLIASLM
jgi:thioredoxin-like negative regulator of GroEL